MNPSLHLLYHEVRPSKSDYSYVMSCEEFQAHCELYAERQHGGQPGQLRPEITFDDGHQSDLIHALPILLRKGLRASFFVTAGWTGKRAGYMNWAQLRELQASGQVIGAHGLTHKLLTGCSSAELDQELRGARQLLEDGLGQSVQVMSLPGGRADGRVLRACFEAGYTQVFTSKPQAEEMDRNPQTVGRLNLVAGTSVPWLASLLDVQSGALAKVRRADQVKSLAKSALGDKIYAKLWAVVNRQEQQPTDVEMPAR